MMEDGLYLPDGQFSQEALLGYQENGVYREVGFENPYSTEFGEEYPQIQGEFQAFNHVVGDGGVGISALHFDSSEELLWMGNQSGHVTSYYGPHLQKYTSFQVNATEGVRSLHTIDRGVLALSQTSLRCQVRRGIPLFTHSSGNMTEMQCMLQIPQRPNQLLMGGLQNKMISLDLEKVKEVQILDTGGSCAVLRYNGRYVGCGETTGKIVLRDPHTMNVCHRLETHSGTLSDFDMNGHHLVTCGFARRHGNMQAIDRFLMVYDLRIMRSVNPIQCVVEPCQLRFLPSLTSKIVVMSASGQVELVDTAELTSANLDIFQLDTGGSMALSFDISPSNSCIAFGDDNSGISLYTASGNNDPTFNPYPRETEFPHSLPVYPPMAIEDPHAIYSSIPLPHLPPDQTQYASDNWPERFAREVYRPVPEIDPEILEAMKMVGSIGYAPNIGNKKRNVIKYNLKKQSDKERSEQNLNLSVDENSAYKSSVPKRYKKNDIKLGKMGVDDFDFDNFNKTSFSGLEASLPNSYCNAMLQILYFTEKLRIIILNHFCSRESCLACELSYLFHMLDTGQGMPCQPANFLRAFRTIPEASALGLIFSEANSIARTSVPRIIQSWNRFILQQVHQHCSEEGGPTGRPATPPPARPAGPGQLNAAAGAVDWSRSSPAKRTGGPDPAALAELADISKDMAEVLSGPAAPAEEASTADDSPVAQLMGMRQDKITRCSKCHTKMSSDNLLLLCNLVYPEQSTLKQKVGFGDILCSSLCPEQVTPAWCEKCRKYQPTTQSRRLRALPHTLSLNAGMDNPSDIAFWNTQMHLILEEAEGGQENQANTVKQVAPPTGQKACRYGATCNRSDCKFWHKGQELLKEPALDVGDQLAKINKSWVPFELTLHLATDGTVHATRDRTDIEFIQTQTYSLYAVCCNVIDPVNPDTTNLVSCIQVGPTYHARIGSPVSQWYIFNDFTINPIPPQEAVWFNLKWKIPCVLCFSANSLPPALESIKFKNPITESVFSEDKSLLQKAGGKRITFTPLSSEELPKKGDLIAIDAEFVTLNQEEAELRSDGKVSTVKAAHMSVARITCVRGQGRLEGVPFIDDYISTQEQVVDYLTKFSGIKPGDLDANFSSKHLTTLKSTYQKLRFLADTGAIFIGHGLKNDFRVINLVVASDQVIDTLYLYHLPHHRFVSLKFLAWFFLKSTIQGATHDSIEDAVTSLRLYRKYLEMKKENKVMDNLTKMYEVGKELNWKVPEP